MLLKLLGKIKMRFLGHLADKIALLLIRRQRVGSAYGLELANIRDSDGRFYRAAYGAIGMIQDYGPHHLKRMRKRFDWVVNKRLCSGEGSTWPDYRLRLCHIDFLDIEDDLATQAFMATTLVEESVRSRFSIATSLRDEELLLRIMERVDEHAIHFSRRLNSLRDGLGDIIASSYEKRTSTERLAWLCRNDTTQLMYEVRRIRSKNWK